MDKVKKILVLPLATGLGLGLSPVASGTVGSFLGVAIVFAMQGASLGWQIGLAAALSIIAIPICGAAEDILQRKDDGRIVADEILTFPLCALGLPWSEHLWLLAVCFVTNRVLDIIKPPPARQAQHLYGGLGIVMDDVLSSLYALGLNWLIWIGVKRMLGL